MVTKEDVAERSYKAASLLERRINQLLKKGKIILSDSISEILSDKNRPIEESSDAVVNATRLFLKCYEKSYFWRGEDFEEMIKSSNDYLVKFLYQKCKELEELRSRMHQSSLASPEKYFRRQEALQRLYMGKIENMRFLSCVG